VISTTFRRPVALSGSLAPKLDWFEPSTSADSAIWHDKPNSSAFGKWPGADVINLFGPNITDKHLMASLKMMF
jgi:hypothetical protein